MLGPFKFYTPISKIQRGRRIPRTRQADGYRHSIPRLSLVRTPYRNARLATRIPRRQRWNERIIEISNHIPKYIAIIVELKTRKTATIETVLHPRVWNEFVDYRVNGHSSQILHLWPCFLLLQNNFVICSLHRLCHHGYFLKIVVLFSACYTPFVKSSGKFYCIERTRLYRYPQARCGNIVKELNLPRCYHIISKKHVIFTYHIKNNYLKTWINN